MTRENSVIASEARQSPHPMRRHQHAKPTHPVIANEAERSAAISSPRGLFLLSQVYEKLFSSPLRKSRDAEREDFWMKSRRVPAGNASIFKGTQRKVRPKRPRAGRVRVLQRTARLNPVGQFTSGWNGVFIRKGPRPQSIHFEEAWESSGAVSNLSGYRGVIFRQNACIAEISFSISPVR